MSSLAANAVLVAHRARLAVSGVSITLRFEGQAITPDAVRGRVRIEESEVDGGGVSFKSIEWIIAREDLVSPEGPIIGPIVPTAGYEIDWIDDAGVKRTCVMVATEGGRCFAPSDADETLYRIFTTETHVNTETPE